MEDRTASRKDAPFSKLSGKCYLKKDFKPALKAALPNVLGHQHLHISIVTHRFMLNGS